MLRTSREVIPGGKSPRFGRGTKQQEGCEGQKGKPGFVILPTARWATSFVDSVEDGAPAAGPGTMAPGTLTKLLKPVTREAESSCTSSASFSQQSPFLTFTPTSNFMTSKPTTA